MLTGEGMKLNVFGDGGGFAFDEMSDVQSLDVASRYYYMGFFLKSI